VPIAQIVWLLLCVAAVSIAVCCVIWGAVAARLSRETGLAAGGLIVAVAGTFLAVAGREWQVVALAGIAVLSAAFAAPAIRAARLDREMAWQRSLARMRAEQVTFVNHEIRTPLTLIQASNEVLLERLAESVQARERELLDVIRRNTNAVISIVERNLADARAEATLFAPELKSTDVRRLLTLTLEEIRRISPIPIRMDVGGAPHRLMIDQSLIRQVVMNLVGNAMQPGRGATAVWVRLLQSDEGATISVSDDGQGMTAEQRKMLFEPYHSDHASSRNVGVGLSISRQIVELHGGRIMVDTMVAAGTTILVTLPSGGGS